MHTLANRVILEDLLTAGLVTGSVDDMMAADIGALFMPHGEDRGRGRGQVEAGWGGGGEEGRMTGMDITTWGGRTEEGRGHGG